MKRIQRTRVKGWKMPENTVYVGRPSKWGNPFKVGAYLDAWGKTIIAIGMTTDVKEVRKIYKSGLFDEKITLENSIKWYEMWLKFMIENKRLNLEEIRGKNLACWCPLVNKKSEYTPCHADILLKYANK